MFILVPKFELTGLVLAQVVQSLFLLLASRISLGYIFEKFRSIKIDFNFRILKEMFNYGFNIQIINLLQLLQDPVTKGLMAYFGGAAIAGMYEVAYQAIYRMRAFMVQVNYAIVPTVARMSDSQDGDTDAIYLKNIHLIFVWGILAFSAVMILSGGLSRVVVGFYEHQLITMIYILSIGWGFNLLASPAYFLYMGDGRIIKNTQFYSIVAILNPILALSLGYIFSWKGVVLGYTLALLVSSIWMITNFKFKSKTSFNVNFLDYFLVFLSLLFITYAWFFPLVFGEGLNISILINFLTPFILFLIVWLNPINMEIRNFFKPLIPNE